MADRNAGIAANDLHESNVGGVEHLCMGWSGGGGQGQNGSQKRGSQSLVVR
ncbi:hypothetical protein D9M68_858600 [compost metagenome]